MNLAILQPCFLERRQAVGAERQAEMVRDFNTREFMQIRHGMKDAQDLLEQGYPKDALAALKRPKKILESKITNLRILALLYVQEAEILLILKRKGKAMADLDLAERVLVNLGDMEDELFEKIQKIRQE